MKEPRKNVTSKKRQKRKIIIVIVEIVVLLIVLAAIFIALKLSKIDSGNKLDEKKVKKNELQKQTKEIMEGHTTIAIFGLDNRSNGNFFEGNSDMIMIANIDEKTKEVKIASVYRDTYLDITNDKGFRKCNAAFAYGGVEQAISMLNVNLDLDIEDYVIVDFNSVIKAVDLLGGVEVEITKEEAYWMQMYIDELTRQVGKSSRYLPGAGTYTLDGIQATAYGRVRYTAGDDYKRTERQRLILEKMVQKALNSDLATINSLVDEVFPEIETSFTSAELLLLAKDAFNYKMGENTGFPFDKQAADFDKAGDCVVPLDLADNVRQLHEFLFGETNYEVTESVQKISDEIEQRSGLGAKNIP